MDDSRFDSLTKSVATGASRRSLLKGLFGLGGVALGGSALRDGSTEAARRPTTPTPTPVKCPGEQILSGGQCVCPNFKTKCGPDCCQPAEFPNPTRSECCDNACCFGTCYGEERCCPTNPPGNGQPPTHRLCDGPNGPVCVQGTCCADSDCGDPCQVCDAGVCRLRCDEPTEVCCVDGGGAVCEPGPNCGCDGDQDCGLCQYCDSGSCLTVQDGQICRDDSGICCSGACVPGGVCCTSGDCSPPAICDNNQCINSCLPPGSPCTSNSECCREARYCSGGRCSQ